MGDFPYAYFCDLKDDVLKEIPWGGFGLFVDAWYQCEFCNMEYTAESYFLERGRNVIGENFKSSGKDRVEITFEKY